MNERIRELAKQAGFCMWDDEEWNPGDIIDWSNSYDKELEKFAELIVRECAYISNINSRQWQSPGTYVLNHFGIETGTYALKDENKK